MKLSTSIKRANTAQRKLSFACDDLKEALENEYNCELEVVTPSGDGTFDIHFVDGSIWELNNAIDILKGITQQSNSINPE